MAKRTKLPLLGALTATPVLTAGVAQAQSFDLSPARAAPAPAQAVALKAELLTLAPNEKLAIAGDRLGGDPLRLESWTAAVAAGGAVKPKLTAACPHGAQTDAVKGKGVGASRCVAGSAATPTGYAGCKVKPAGGPCVSNSASGVRGTKPLGTNIHPTTSGAQKPAVGTTGANAITTLCHGRALTAGKGTGKTPAASKQ